MASFLHQLKVLLWKNWLSVYRQPVWSIVLIFWPVVIFFILAMTRIKFGPVQVSDCYLAPRNLQSTGMIPFLQNVLCDTDITCNKTSYVPNPVTTRSRLKKRFADSGGGDLAFQMRSSTNQTPSSLNTAVVNNWTAVVDILNAGKSVMQDISSGDLKGALCSTIHLYPPTEQMALQQFCQSNKTLAAFAIEALLSQANISSSGQILSLVNEISSKVQVLQNNKALWNFLLMLPEYFKNPPSFAYSGEFVLNFSTVPQELSYIQPCVKSITKIISEVILPSPTNVSNILQTLSNQALVTEMKSCISLFQMLPCGSSYNCLAMEETPAFQTIYWLVMSLTKENSSNACKYDFSSLDCNNSINWDFFLQSSITLLKEVNDNSTALTRYVQKIWTLIKQNDVNQIIIEKLRQEINNTYPLEPQLQSILTEMVYLLLNTTDALITESFTGQNFGALQTILIKLEKLVPPELLANFGNNTGLINNLTENIINDIQYWIHLSGLFSSSNVSLQTLAELQTIIKTLSTTSTEAANDLTKLLSILNVFNQTIIQEFTQSLQNLPNVNLITTNITAALTQVIILFNDIISNPSTNNSFVLADFYLKQILKLLNSDTTLQNALGLLRPYFNYSQAGDFSRYATILSFFTPSNLQKVGSNPNNASLALLSLISSFIPVENQQSFNKVAFLLNTLLDSVSTCSVELTKCSSSVVRFQQQLYEVIQFISSANNGVVLQFPQLNQLNEVEIKIIDNMFSMILCSQAHINNDSCNNVQDIYGEISYIINMITDSNLLSIFSVLQQSNQNVENILHVFGSVNLPKLISQLDYVAGLSKCYTNGSADALRCTLDLSLSLMDLLHMLPFPQPINGTLVAASSIIKNWLNDVNRTVDIHQQLIYLHDITSMAFQNQSVLQKIELTLLQIVQTLEELNKNSTSLTTALLIKDLLESLNFANVNIPISTSLFSQIKQELENINIHLQTIQWYILYVKNETEAFHTPSNIASFVTLIEVMIKNALSVMKTNPSLVPFVNEAQSVISWLEKLNIVPALQSMANMTLQDGGQIMETFINNIVLVIQQIIQQEFVSESPWSSNLNQIIDSEAKFVLELLQEYESGRLNNLSSVMLFTEKVLLAMESLLKDIPVNITFNYNLQTTYNISQQVLGIVYNAENKLNQSVLYYVYNLLLDSWSGSIFYEFPLLKTKLMDLLHLSIQCLTDSTMPSLKENCSSTDIINMLQLIMNDLGCQISLESPTINSDVTLINIFEYILNTTWEGINGCNIENSKTKEELACLVETLASTIKLISITNNLTGINSPWVQETHRAIAVIMNKLLTNNITCTAKDSQIIHIIYQAHETQSSQLQSLISAFMNNIELHSQNPTEYSEYLLQVFNIIKLYDSMHEKILLNETIVKFWYNTILQLLEITKNSTIPTKWLLVSSMLNTVNNISSYFKTTDYPIEFFHLQSIINRVLNLTDTTVTLSASLPHISLSNIFNRNFSMINDFLKQFLSDMNITSVDNCESSIQNLFSLHHNKMNLTINEIFYSNFSFWTCSLILANNSGFNWLDQMETIISMIITPESGLPVGSAMKIITSFTKFLNDTNMKSFEAFVASLAELLQQREPTMNLNVYRSIQELYKSLQAIINEAMFNSSVPKDEIITVKVMGALNSFLRNLNITSYEETITFAFNILQIYFNNRNNALPLEDLAQKVLGGILKSFQESGLETIVIQALENQIFPQFPEEQRLIQYFIHIVISAINKKASSVAQQTPSINNNLVFNFIQNALELFNSTTTQEIIHGNSNLTIAIASLVKKILQSAENWKNILVSMSFPQNGSEQIINDLEKLLNRRMSQSIGNNEFYANYSSTIIKLIYIFSTETEKPHAMHSLQQVLALLNHTNVPALVSTLEILYDFIHLNNTTIKDESKLFIKQLENFIFSSQIKQYLSEISYLLNTTEKLPLFQTSEFKDAALAILPYLYPPMLFNISSNSKNITSMLLNLVNTLLGQQKNTTNTTEGFVLFLKQLEQCSTHLDHCVGAISGFESLAMDAINAIFSIKNGSNYFKISSETVMKFDKLTDLQVSLINSVFITFWRGQEDLYNSTEDFANAYQEVISASQFILNITGFVNTTIPKQDLEVLQKYLQKIRTIHKVISTSNITQSLLQLHNIQWDSQCENQNLACSLNLTSNLLKFIQSLKEPHELMEQILVVSTIIDFWKNELNTTGNMYHQMISLYNLTKTVLQNEPVLHRILTAVKNISKIIVDIRNNMSLSTMEEQLLSFLDILQIDSSLSSFNYTLNLSSTQLDNLEANIQIIQWYITYIKNQTESSNLPVEMYALYRLTHMILADMISKQLNTTILSQMEKWINSAHVLSKNNSFQGLKMLNVSESTTIWQIINSLMDGNLNTSQIEEILRVVQNAMSSQNITLGSDIFHLYELFVGIFNQPNSNGSINVTQILHSFLSMDCEGVSKVISSVYKMIQMGSDSFTWPVDTFFSNITMDMCHLLKGNYSQNNWISILQTSIEFVSYVTPLVPDNVGKYFTVAEYIIKVATDLIEDPTISQSKITSIMNIVQAINELFNNTSNSSNWEQNTILYKLVYFSVDLAWTSSSDKELILSKTQNFFVEIIQDIQNMLKLQSGSPYDVWISFALDVVRISINTTQNTSLHERFLDKVWDSFKQNGLEHILISSISGSASLENAYILEHFLQLVFNITDMVIAETQSNVTTDIIGKVINIALNDLFQILLVQNKNISLLLGEGIQFVNVTKILNELQMFINSLTTVNLPQNISNEPAILLNLLNALKQSYLMNIIGNFLQTLTTSENMNYIKMVMDALRMFGEFTHMNNSTGIQEFSSILVKYLPIYLDTNNRTQTSLMPILNLCQYIINITNTQNSDTSKGIAEILPLFKSHFLVNESINVHNLSFWLVGVISQITATNEQARLENAANASLLLIKSIQECAITPMTCTGLIEIVEHFMFYLELELSKETATSVNSSLLQSGSYNQSQITIINEVFLVLSYALGYPNNSTNGTVLFEEFSTLTNVLLNRTIEHNLNISSLSTLKNIVEVLKSVNITQVLLQSENLVHAYMCTNQTDVDPLLCKLDVTFKLAQLLKLLPLAQSTHENVAIISSIAEQWLNQLNVNTSVYQQIIKLYNITVLAFKYHPTLQAIQTSLVNIVHILQDMGLLVNASFNGSDIAVNLLFQIVKIESVIMDNVTILSQFNISDLLQIMQLELNTVNWLLLQAENQTGIVTSFPGVYLMHTVTQWIIKNYPQLTLIVTNIEDIITSYNLSLTNSTIDALKTIVEDLLTTFLPQTEDVQVIETLQTVLNVTGILLKATSQDTFNRIEMLINSLRNPTFQFMLSNDPSQILNILSALNKTDFISKIAEVIQSVISKDVQYSKVFINAQKMLNDLLQLNNTKNTQDISAIFTKYLPILSDSNNQTQESLSAIFNLWQYFIILTEKQSNLTQAVVDILPFFQSHMLLNESIDVNYLASRIVNLISQYMPPTEKGRFEQAANASLLFIQTCSATPTTCTGFVHSIQKFVSDVTQLELMIQNKTLVNTSLLLEFEFYNQSQIKVINEVFLVLSYAAGYSFNPSTNETGLYEGIVTLTKWLLNTTTKDNLNTVTLAPVKDILKVLTSTNITQFLLQTENIIDSYTCRNQTDIYQLVCKLNVTFQLTHLFQLIPLAHSTQDKLGIIYSIAEKWLSQLDGNLSNIQQLADLNNVTIVALQYHHQILQAINTSLVNTVTILKDMGIFNFSVNTTDLSIRILSDMIQTINSEISMYTNNDVLQYNISNILENIKFQLDTVNWLLLWAKDKSEGFSGSTTANEVNTATKWLTTLFEQIPLILKDFSSFFNSFNSTSIETDLLHIFNVTLSSKPIQALIQQAGAEIQSATNSSLINNLLNQSIQKDAEIALLLLQQINRNNISFILTSINQVLQTIQGVHKLDLAYRFYSNTTIEKIFIIVKEGMAILNDIATKGTIEKEDIYKIYNFTYLLVQGEWNWVPFQNISAMEAELLDVFYMAMKPFLGGSWTQVYTGNCSAQDVLQILVQTIFKNATSNMTVEKTTCDWQLIYSSSEINSFSNHSLGDMIYLALQSSPVFNNVCSKDSLHPLAEEIACLMQVMGVSMSILADLNKISGLQLPLIQSLNNSLTFICNNMLAHNSTFQQESQLLNTLIIMFRNQSNPVHVFIQFLIDHYSSPIQISDLQQLWAKVSNIINILSPENSTLDAYINELVLASVNMTIQPNWLESWQTLNNLISMNWTAVNIDVAQSALNQLRRAVILIDNGLDIKTIQIYQAIVSLIKNPSFTSLLDMTNSLLLNGTASSTSECASVLSAVTKVFHSIWLVSDPTNSYLDEGLFSNFSLLACQSLHIQSENISTWISLLETLKNIMPYLTTNTSADITNYITGLEKIIVFVSDAITSQTLSPEIMFGGVYDLFIQELKLFSNNMIADWMGKIPVNQIISSFTKNITVEQIIATEQDLLYSLLRILNSTSYSEGVSMLSDLVTYSSNSVSRHTATGLSQQLLNLIIYFTNTVQVSGLTEPYGTVMNCLKNVAQDISSNLNGHLEEAIQLAQDLFTQSNESANASAIPDLLKQKMYQLQNLSSIICGLEDSNNSLSYCNMPCQFLTLVQDVGNLLSSEIKFTQTVVSLPTITSFLGTLWKAFENEINDQLSTLIPINNLTVVVSALNQYINVTNPDFQAILANIFQNSSHVEDELRQIVKLNQTSIKALMNVLIPDNKTEIATWFTILNECSTNTSLVAEPFRVFCFLTAEQGYQMTIIFLENVDFLKLLYRLAIPSSWQTSFDLILTAIKTLIDRLDNFLKDMPPETEITNFLNLIKTFNLTTTRSKRSADPLDFPETTRISIPSFTTLSKIICSGNMTQLFGALLTMYPLTRTATNRNSERAQSIYETYGIPTNNSFCAELFVRLVETTSGASYWTLLKPLLYGQILYAPNTDVTQKIMEKTTSKILQVMDYKNTIQNMTNSIQKIMTYWPFMQLAQKLFGTVQNILNNTVVSGILQDFLNLNVTDLSEKINKADGLIDLIGQNVYIIQLMKNVCNVLLNFMSCMSYNRIQPMASSDEMMAKAEQLQKSNELFAAVTFNLPSGSNRQKRSLSNLPKQISYSITMRSLLSENTDSIRSSYWIPGPHNTLNKYSRGFVYLQENIDRAIIEMQTNKILDDIGVQFQPMPYPCYIKDNFLYSMGFSLPIALMISWVLFIASFVKKLVHEKELRLHEYMRMMGVNSCSHFFAWFIESASFLVLTVSILVLILKFGKLLTYSNGFILFLFFLDYSLTIIAMSFLISVFFHNTNVAGLSGSLIYIITFFPFIAVVSRESDLSFAGKTLLSLFSPTAMSYAMQYIVHFEEQDEGIQWHNVYTSQGTKDSFNFGWLCWVLLIDSMIYFIIGWYIKLVFPGKYGIGAVWYFPVLPSFWMECCGLQSLCSRKPSGLLMSNIVAHGVPEKKGDELYPYNEREPTDLNLGVSLHGLTKVYQSKVAVKNLNLNFYEGHITALLGHNGAGKTTTLSMLTGLFSASSGTIYVYGEDIRTHLHQVRKSLGVCMQYDVLFDHLTTKEHLLLYGSIKAPQWHKIQLHEEVKRTLKETGLYNHRHKPVRALSGGMRRKLSISIALIGGSKVVVLDEPTTGVDPCSRRGIWEVISKNKKDKTIILSTHHLDEAEVLSDRIAFLEQGGLRCCGTPMFLKEKFGSGYHLTLTKKFPNQKDNRLCESERVTALIQSHIPEATLKEDVGGELVYVLPPFKAEISNAYLSLLRDLDANLNDLCLGCYGISDTTIEEVFLKLTDGLDEDDHSFSQGAVPIPNNDGVVMEDESSTNVYTVFDKDDQPLTKQEKVKGVKLFFKKIGAIFIKRFHNSKRNWKGLISQLLLPVLFVIAAMGLGSLSTSTVNYPTLLLTPELYGTTEQAVVFGINNKSSKSLMDAMSSFPGIDNFCMDNKAQCLSENSLGSWKYTGDQMLTYDNCNCSTGITACGSADITPPHRMTFSKQMMYNISGKNMENYLMATTLQYIQKRYGGWSFGLPASQIRSFLPLPENLTLNKVWYNNEGPHSLPAFLNSFSNFLLRANLPSDEAAEYGIFVYNKPLPGTVTQSTATTTLVNTLVALSVLVGYSITTASFVTYVVKEYDNGSKRLQHIAGVGEALYWITNFIYDLVIYFVPVALSLAMIAAFKLPAFYNYPNLGGVALLFILFGYATFAWMYLIAGTFKNAGMAFITYVCINLFIGINTIISSSVVYMLVQQKGQNDKDYQSLNDTYNVLISIFKIFPQFCFGYGLIQLSQQQAIQDQYAIFGNNEKVDIFKMDILGYMFVAMTIQGTFCFLLRLLINDGIVYSVKTLFKKWFNLYPLIVKDPDEDEDVQSERERVQSGSAQEDLLVLGGLTKVFHQVNKNVFAVNNMCLGIPPGECFGLLGVNGAGKTTTFKMLTGETSPSSGNIQVRNHMGILENILGFNTDWSSFGYCPQEDALDELMTGLEHLYYYARIHGIPERRIKSVTNQLLHKLQLVQYKNKITGSYSCGTRRKLSTALALIGRPSILLLDEPSSGMDPKTKRHLWKIISEEIQEKCAVVLTSHSMEECEALCTRLAIMVKGKFQCIGSLQHIKSRFGSGFTVKMHLKDSSVSIETITNFMHFHFPNTYLKDQHFSMAEYHVPMSVGGVASIFDLLESNKTALNIIHFSVSQTTLDEVFINFAQTSTDNFSLNNVSSQDLQVVVA